MGIAQREITQLKQQVKILQEELDRLKQIVDSDVSRSEKVKAGAELPAKITEGIGKLINEDYQRIEDAIDNLDSRDPEMGKKANELIQLKKIVPDKYSLSKNAREEILAEINKILGVNRSDDTP